MDNIINELIEIETRAQDIMSHTLEEKRNLAIRIHNKTDEIRERIEGETSIKVKNMYDAAVTESAERIDEIKSEAIRWQEDIKRNYSKNCEKWEQEIFDKVVGLSR